MVSWIFFSLWPLLDDIPWHLSFYFEKMWTTGMKTAFAVDAWSAFSTRMACVSVSLYSTVKGRVKNWHLFLCLLKSICASGRLVSVQLLSDSAHTHIHTCARTHRYRHTDTHTHTHTHTQENSSVLAQVKQKCHTPSPREKKKRGPSHFLSKVLHCVF